MEEIRGVMRRCFTGRREHFMGGEMVHDIIMGMSDGLTVPFTLPAGLSAATASSSIIVTAGLAQVAVGAFSMGLGEYLAAKSEADHYMQERRREQEEIKSVPNAEAAEVANILAKYGLQPNEYWPVVNALRKRPDAWLDFMMRFELGLEKPDPKRGLQSAFTIAIAYVIGGLVPLIPYVFIPIVENALIVSVIVTLIALLFFGYIKGHYTRNKPIRSAIKIALIGAFARLLLVLLGQYDHECIWDKIVKGVLSSISCLL